MKISLQRHGGEIPLWWNFGFESGGQEGDCRPWWGRQSVKRITGVNAPGGSAPAAWATPRESEMCLGKRKFDIILCAAVGYGRGQARSPPCHI